MLLTTLLLSALMGPPLPSTAPPGTPIADEALRKPRGLGPGWYAFAIGGQVADFASTQHFLAAGRLEETNPRLKGIVDNVPVYLAVKVGAGLLAARVGDLIASYGKRRGVRWVVWFGRAVAGAAGVDGMYLAIRNEIRLARAR